MFGWASFLQGIVKGQEHCWSKSYDMRVKIWQIFQGGASWGQRPIPFYLFWTSVAVLALGHLLLLHPGEPVDLLEPFGHLQHLREATSHAGYLGHPFAVMVSRLLREGECKPGFYAALQGFNKGSSHFHFCDFSAKMKLKQTEIVCYTLKADKISHPARTEWKEVGLVYRLYEWIRVNPETYKKYPRKSPLISISGKNRPPPSAWAENIISALAQDGKCGQWLVSGCTKECLTHPKRMNFRKSSEGVGSFSIQKFML